MCACCTKTGRPGRARALPGAERLPRFGGELWAPYLRDTLLRVFASAGASGQLGRFTRPWLDYTAASVRSAMLHASLCHTLGFVIMPFQWSRCLACATRCCACLRPRGPPASLAASCALGTAASLVASRRLQPHPASRTAAAQVRLDLGLTSPQAQWLARGGSGLSGSAGSSGSLWPPPGASGSGQDAGSSAGDLAAAGALGSPYKHRQGPSLSSCSLLFLSPAPKVWQCAVQLLCTVHGGSRSARPSSPPTAKIHAPGPGVKFPPSTHTECKQLL